MILEADRRRSLPCRILERVRVIEVGIGNETQGGLPAHGGQALRYGLERIRAGSHELTELDLVDALRVGQLRVPDAHRDPALRVLGGYGVDPRTRLGLPADAHPARLAAAAAAQREHWHRLATHPAATAHLHTVATAATHTCDQLLGRA